MRTFLVIRRPSELNDNRKHGTFRPKLLQLVQSNDADLVLQTTEEAFAPILKYDNVDISDASGESDMIGDANKSLKVLTALKGVGPATASLLLSVVAPTRIPFFSDELFRWAMFDESGSPGGWKRTIKYNAKEYNELIKKVDVLVSRLGVRALDAEKVAYVLGKEGADLADGNEDRAAQQSTTIEPVTTLKKEDSKPEVEEPKIEEPKKGTKRKQSTSKPQTEGMRKSTRTKK